MKKLLAMALTLALCLALAVPALAVETKDPVELMEELGILEIPPMDGEYTYVDPYEAYEQAHPEELAALDVNGLLAAWGYRDMTAGEVFLREYGWYGDTVEEAVRSRYIQLRATAQMNAEAAASYREEYPDAWGGFDPEVYFQTECGEYWDSKAAYMANFCLFTQEEFVDDMFTDYMERNYIYEDDNNGDYSWIYDVDQTQDQPTLTLMVNGVASGVAVTAQDGVSYADAAALRTILGDKAVPADVAGNTAIRPAAQAAGWDVAWYGGGWRGMDQEIQLWDKAAFASELDNEFGPFNDFMTRLMSISRDVLNTQTPMAGHETATIDLKRFSSLDGDRTYTLTLTIDYTVQAGVMDMTIAFDLSQLLQTLAPTDRAWLADQEEFDLAKLTQLLKAGKMEFIIDYNEGVVAWNVPLLALLDPDMEGWHTQRMSGWEDMKESLMGEEKMAFTSTLYAVMTNQASAPYGGGAASALESYRGMVDTLGVFAGKDRFTTQNGKTTWTVTTQQVNRAMAQALELEEPEKVSFFKAYEIACSLDSKDNISMDAHFRLDVDGIAAALAQDSWDYYDFGDATVASLLMGLLDMDLTATASGNRNNATSRVGIHWNNVGSLDLRAQSTAAATAKSPRQIADLDLKAELWGPFGPDFGGVADEVDPAFSVGLIGGADGPTAVFTTH